jgi:hypothetical protein
MYTRILATSDNGGPLEVHFVMLQAPLAWSCILGIDSICSFRELYARVVEYEKVLASAGCKDDSTIITSDNLAAALRKIRAFQGSSQTSQTRNVSATPARPYRQANLAGHTPGEGETVASSIVESNVSGAGEVEILKQAFQLFKQWQRDPPAGRYPFAKNNHVMTKMSWVPPSPCKVCGSSNHWDRECPDWDTYLVTTKKSAKFISNDEEELASYYGSAYQILHNQRIAGQLIDTNKMPTQGKTSDFDVAVLANSLRDQGRKTRITECKHIYDRTTVEDVNGREDGDLCSGQERKTSALESSDNSPCKWPEKKPIYHSTMEEIELPSQIGNFLLLPLQTLF